MGAVYLVTIFLFLPFPFMSWCFEFIKPNQMEFPFQKLGEYTSALLCICSMLFLGFADDVLNLKWRHKILLPAMATLPLLIIYRVTYGVTSVVVPLQLRSILGPIVELGPLYYIYMAMMSIFCTHSINILAGVNGVEVGQSLVIAFAVTLNSTISIIKGESIDHAYFALYLMLPFIGVGLALLKHNWWPAKVFVGDTFCYFAGMTFAVVGILGHFSKTLLIFFLPQVFNFVMSLPQLAGIIPCPRHRLPRLNEKTGLLEPSTTTVTNAGIVGSMIIAIFKGMGIVKEYPSNPDGRVLSNFTLLNALLVLFGPVREDRLCILLMLVQSLVCACGFIIRYHISTYFFP